MSEEVDSRPPRGLYTEQEVAEYQVSEAKLVLKGVLRNLQEVRAQRAVMPDWESALARARRQGEIWGLDAAIAAVERRIR